MSRSHNASMHTSAYRWWPSPTYIIIFWWFVAMMYRKQCTSVDSLVWKVNTSTRQSESPFVVRHHDRKLTHRTYRAASWIVNRCVKDTKRDKFQMIILIFSNLLEKNIWFVHLSDKTSEKCLSFAKSSFVSMRWMGWIDQLSICNIFACVLFSRSWCRLV